MKRLESLDALRGFDMLFISGGAALIVALANCFPDNSFWGLMSEQMEHVPWEGLQHHDTIFPLFLFIAGVSFPFSLEKQIETGKSRSAIYTKILRRGFTLVLLGLIYNGMLQFEFGTLRFCSVLSRIGLAWMFGAIIFTSIKNIKCIVAILIGLLVGYWLIMAYIPSPEAAEGVDVFSKEGSISCYIDRMILGVHCYRPEYDPEGLFSTIPAIGTALLGMLSGAWIKRDEKEINGTQKVLGLIVAGIVMGIIAWGWNMVFPINKALWSSSFVCAVGSYSLIMLAIFYYIIDVKGWRIWDKFFVVIGMNSITIYLAQRFISFGDIEHKIFGGFINLFHEEWSTVADKACYILLVWLFLYFLYRQKIFLKV